MPRSTYAASPPPTPGKGLRLERMAAGYLEHAMFAAHPASQCRYWKNPRTDKDAEVARLQDFIQHMHMHTITQWASWISKLWYANVPRPQILTDQDIAPLLNGVNAGNTACSGFFKATLNEYNTNTENCGGWPTADVVEFILQR
ncbi:hypothetical protein HDU90_002863 [Geranomyces variabilis]|nr:hypothetical protein HDU90_002863 [Geranomyces variabilis]